MTSLFRRKPYLLATLIALLFTLWIISGQFTGKADAKEEEAQEAGPLSAQGQNGSAGNKPVNVQTVISDAQAIDRVLLLYGQAEPSRQVTLKAQTPGEVSEVLVARGEPVRKHQVIARLKPGERPMKVAQSRALLEQRVLEHKGAQSLRKQGLNAEGKLAEAFANLESARAELKKNELDMEYTVLRAPFDGILNERYIEVGDFVTLGQDIGVILDNDPLVVRGDVAEADVALLQQGKKGAASFTNRGNKEGVIRYISNYADQKTRTFKIELAIDNPGQALPAGLSSTVEIPLEVVSAHKVSPGLMALNEDGVPGLKVIDEANSVIFKAIQVVKTEPDGIWVKGLAKTEQVISQGQGFVRHGQRVNPTLKR